MQDEHVEATIALIANTPQVVRAMVAGLPHAVVQPSVDGRWGALEVVAHLLDVEGIGFRERMQRIIEADHPAISSIDPGGRLQDGGYLRRTVAELIEEFERRRAEDVSWLRTLTPEQLARSGEHDRAGTITAGNVFHYWPCHDQIHIRQLSNLLQAISEPRIGATRAFFEEV